MDKSAHDNTRVQERQWIEALQNGDDQALRTIYTELGSVLYHFAQRLVPADLAEDVIQDVLIDLWERRTTLEIRGSIRSYLFGATYRCAMNMQRRMRIAQNATLRITQDYTLLPAGAAAPDRLVESREAQVAVAKAIAVLPHRTRLILALRWHDNMTYEEIAGILEISIDAAKKQGRRGEQALGELLKDFS